MASYKFFGFFYSLLAVSFLSAQTSSLTPSTPPQADKQINYSYWPKRSSLWEKSIALIREGKAAEARKLMEEEKAKGNLPAECIAMLTEMQFNDLYDPKASDKQEYVVKRGDSLFSIARKTKCSADYIMAINNLSHPARLNIGDKLFVRELNMSLLIDVKKKTLSLVDKGVPVKEYELKALRDNGVGSVKTKLAQKNGEIDGLPVPSANELFPASTKTLHLKDGLVIKGTKNATAPEPGFFLAPEDVNELALFLANGNDVEIRR